MCGVAAALGVSTVIQAYSNIQQAEQSAREAEEAADVAEVNAALAKEDAKLTAERGARAEATVRTQSEVFKGAQIAAFGASGAEVGTGSFAEVVQDTERISEVDALTIREDATTGYQKLIQESTAFEKRAKKLRSSAGRIRSAGNLNAFGTVLGGSANIALSRYKRTPTTTPSSGATRNPYYQKSGGWSGRYKGFAVPRR